MSIKSLKLIFFIFSPTLLFGQDLDRNKGVYVTFNLQTTFHTKTTFEIVNNNTVYTYEPQEAVTSTSAYSFELGYFVLPKKLALGVAVSIESNSTFGVAYLPYFLNLKYLLSPDRNTIFLVSDFGRIQGLFGNNATGAAFNFGIGKKLFFTNKLALNFAIVYSIRDIEYEDVFNSVAFNIFADRYLLNAHGLEIRLGLFF